MKFSEIYTYVLFSVLLLSSTVISDHVSSLPLTIVEELKSNSMDGYSNYDDVLRLVPTGPNPMKSPGTPPTPSLSKALYDFDQFDVLRTVPSGPDPKHHEEIPPTPPTSEVLFDSSTYKLKTLNNDNILRRVPKGANPPESPPLNVLRTVPSGPDPKHHEEIPPTPPASEFLYDSSIFKGFKLKTLNNDDILRCVPKGVNPPESPPLNVLRTVPSGPDPKHHEEIPPTPPALELLCDSSTFKGFKLKISNSLSKFDDILRGMPKGPNSLESPPLNVLRTVPSGPDPKHHEAMPPEPPASELLRHVPNGLN
ncbi:hypothetical protein M0R45_018898 [Rubus argutus]|uniref:Uncharacterized protein n=1 Tax=Rubus argutus TaxID=59490 RepID=A0AAW1X5M8_RUBAR